MARPVIDLRSDTVTKPTPAMRDAMARAELGDDVFGDDPAVNALQQRIASLADIEAAIKPDDPHFAITRLLCLENTIGGKVLPRAYLEQATALARSRGLA